MAITTAFKGLKVLIIRCKHRMDDFNEFNQELKRITDIIMKKSGVRVDIRDRENMLFKE